MIPQHDIHEIDAFLRDHYASEQPVVFRQAVRTAASANDLCRELNSRIVQDESTTQRFFWYDVPPDLLNQICGTPKLIDRIFNEQEAYIRDNCVRIWFNPQGHQTPWHYDGHSLHVFNLQLKGRKRWTIVSPKTPLPNMPFSKTCISENNSLEGKDYYQFDLEEGDMLFLPRYWYHHVKSVDPLNVNVNWVLMSKQPPISSPIARREREVLWVLERIYPILLPSTKALLDEYAGCGREAVHSLTSQVTASAGLRRAVRETSRAPLVALSLRSQIQKLRSLLKTKRQLRRFIEAQQTGTRSTSEPPPLQKVG